MALLMEFAIILGVSLAAEILYAFLPLPIPASIYGMLLMLGLLASGALKPVPKGAIVLGELALSGAVRPIAGILPMLIDAYDKGYSVFFVPADNAAEAAYIRGARVFPVETLQALVAHLRGEDGIPKRKRPAGLFLIMLTYCSSAIP